LAFHAFCPSCSVYIGIQAYQTQSILSGLLAGFLLSVVTNSGCGGECSATAKKKE
jgi:hypothetical protein